MPFSHRTIQSPDSEDPSFIIPPYTLPCNSVSSFLPPKEYYRTSPLSWRLQVCSNQQTLQILPLNQPTKLDATVTGLFQFYTPQYLLSYSLISTSEGSRLVGMSTSLQMRLLFTLRLWWSFSFDWHTPHAKTCPDTARQFLSLFQRNITFNSSFAFCILFDCKEVFGV